MRKINKEIFLNTMVCPTLGWYHRSGKIDEIVPEPTKGQQFRLEQGREIGRRARELFVGGELVEPDRLGGASFLEDKDSGTYTRVGLEYAGG